MITDETRGFDHISAGYHGPLYAEISQRTGDFFRVLVHIQPLRSNRCLVSDATHATGSVISFARKGDLITAIRFAAWALCKERSLP